mgnify:CR=1 FL=1
MISIVLVSLIVASTSLNVYGIHKYYHLRQQKKEISDRINRLQNMRRIQQKYGILY